MGLLPTFFAHTCELDPVAFRSLAHGTAIADAPCQNQPVITPREEIHNDGAALITLSPVVPEH